MTSPYVVYMLENNVRIGEVEFIRLEAANRYLKPGRWELTTNRLPGPVSWKSRIEIQRNNDVVFSGPFFKAERQWTYAETDSRMYSGPCDNIYLTRAVASPDPTLSGPPYNTQAADVRTGVAETVIRNYVRYNIGDLAVTLRRLSNLTFATDLGRGKSVSGRARFDNLMDLCKLLAENGAVGFEIVGMQLRFYVPSDKTSTVVFSDELDNIKSFEYYATAPEANYAIVAGSGEGTARNFYELGDSTSINLNGRMEIFVDARNSTGTAELAQRAHETLYEKGSGEMNVHVIPGTAALKYMLPYDNFYLGDMVSLVVDQEVLTAQVQEIGILETKEDAYEHITLGTYGKSRKALTMYDILGAISRRVQNLEVR